MNLLHKYLLILLSKLEFLFIEFDLIHNAATLY